MSFESSEYIFNYLDDIWSLMPEEDRTIFAETWKGYEQTYGDIWVQMFERQMGVNIDFLPLYAVRRWLSHSFNESTKISRPAIYRSGQDLTLGINLESRYLIAIRIDGGPVVEIDMRGEIPSKTRLVEIVNRINVAVGQQVSFAVSSNQLLEFRSPTIGANSRIEFFPASSQANDASEIVLGLDPVQDLPTQFPKFPFDYQLADSFIVAIPSLQNKIKDENITLRLRADIDYSIEFGTGVISFAQIPPEFMWAQDTLFNKETPYNNYGFLLDIYDKNTEGYLKAVKGLWYAFWTGPRPENIRRSLCLLFGLPTASKPGVVQNVDDFSVTLAYDDGTTETFEVPQDLSPIVLFNQRVTRFEPLTTGIRVIDKVNYPGFLEREVGRTGVQIFLTQNATKGVDPDTDESKALKLVEQNTYLPQIDVASFISPDIKLNNVRTFLTTIQPKSRTFLFQVLVGKFREKLDLRDEGLTGVVTDQFPNGQPSLGLAIRMDVTPNVDSNPNTFAQNSDLLEAELNDYTYMRLDEGWAMADRVQIEVQQANTLVDSFELQG